MPIPVLCQKNSVLSLTAAYLQHTVRLHRRSESHDIITHIIRLQAPVVVLTSVALLIDRQIISTVSDAAATKAPLARIADKVSGVFVPAVIGIALLTLIGWLIAGRPFSFAIARGISVLVISCPCALGLATPVAIMVGSGVGAKTGVLYKTAAALEGAGRTQIVALDKTGTVTEGEASAFQGGRRRRGGACALGGYGL